MAKKIYEIKTAPHILEQLKKESLDLFENNFEKFRERQVQLRDSLVIQNPDKLWCRYTARMYSNKVEYMIETIGFVQAIFFSTGKARIRDPLGVCQSGDFSSFEIINPENLSFVLSNLPES